MIKRMVDRQGFINWCGGILLQRDATSYVLTPERDCLRAEEALERGEIVGLTLYGELFSTISLTKQGYMEEKLEENNATPQLRRTLNELNSN